MPDPNQNDSNSQQNTAVPAVPSVPTNPVPSFVSQSDLPPLPPDFQNVASNPAPVAPATTTTVTETTTTSTEPLVQTGTAAPTEFPSMVSTPKKKFGGGRIIATILGLFLLVGGVGAGIVLTQQQQIFQPQAAVNSQCIGTSDGKYKCKSTETCDNGVCKKKPTGTPAGSPCTCMNSHGTNTGDGTCTNGVCHCDSPNVVKKDNCSGGGSNNGGGTFCVFDHWQQHNVCRQVGGVWKRCANADPTGETGFQSNCTKDYVNPSDTGGCTASQPNCSSHSGGTYCLNYTSCTPTIVPNNAGCVNDNTCGGNQDTASCTNIKAYNASWAALSTAQLAVLTPGTSVNFCVIGSASGGSFDKAKFTINGAAQAETTAKRPGNQDFCQSYAIPAGVTTFNVTAQIHHTTLGWK